MHWIGHTKPFPCKRGRVEWWRKERKEAIKKDRKAPLKEWGGQGEHPWDHWRWVRFGEWEFFVAGT